MSKNRKQAKKWRPVRPHFVAVEYVWFDALNDSFALDMKDNLGMTPSWTGIYCPFGEKTVLLNRKIYTHNTITVCCPCHGVFTICKHCFHASIHCCPGRDAIWNPCEYVWAPLFRFFGKTTFEHEKAQQAAQDSKAILWTEVKPAFYQKKNTEDFSIYKLLCLQCGAQEICIF